MPKRKPSDPVAKARWTRSARTASLTALKSGKLPVVQLFTNCPEELQGATVAAVLSNVPKLRDAQVRDACVTFGIWPLDPWGTAVLGSEYRSDGVRQRLMEHGVL